MRKFLSLILALVLLFSFSGLLTSCTEKAPADGKTPADQLSGTVLVVKANADDSLPDALCARLTAAGASVNVKTFAELASEGLHTDGIDLIIHAAGALCYLPVLSELNAYLAAGGAMMTLGDAPFSEAAYLLGDRYVASAGLLDTGRVIEDFDDESVLSRLTSTTDKFANFKTTLTVDDSGSGYGNALTCRMEMFRHINYHTMDVDLSGANALAMRIMQSVDSNRSTLMAETSDGALWYADVPSAILSEDWYTYVVPASAFLRAQDDGSPADLDAPKTETLNFDDVKKLSFGLNANFSPSPGSTDYLYRFDRIVAVTLGDVPPAEETDTAPALFSSDYYYTYAPQTLSSATDAAGTSYPLSGSCYTLTVENPGLGAGLRRMTPILTAGNSLAAWLSVYKTGASVAVFGSSDSAFWQDKGAELAADTAGLLLGGTLITALPQDTEIFSDLSAHSIPVTVRADLEDAEALTLTCNAKFGDNSDGIETSYRLSELTRLDDGYSAAFDITPPDGSAASVTVTLKKNDTVIDSGSLRVAFSPAPKPLRVSCVGDSLTEGFGSPAELSYPAQLSEISGPLDITAQNYGISGTTTLKTFGSVFRDNDYWTVSHETEADYVVILFGNNEATLWDSVKGFFYEEFEDFVMTYEALPSKPQILICLPIPRLSCRRIISITRNEITPMLEQMAADHGWAVLDLYDCLEGRPYLMGEQIHPSGLGYGVMAHAIYDKIAAIEADK